mgnify:CR=1 FL=1
MPVLIDKAVERDQQKGYIRDLTIGVPLRMTDAQRDTVVMTRYVSTDKFRADFQPDGEWHEEVTSDIARGRRATTRLKVHGIDGEERPVSVDDGLIIGLVGTMSSVVGIIPGRPPLSLAEVDDHMDATEEDVPMFEKWDFRVHKILKTDGPEARQSLARSEDHKRQTAQTEMYEAFSDMFKNFQEGMAIKQQEGDLAPSLQETLDAGSKATEPTITRAAKKG